MKTVKRFLKENLVFILILAVLGFCEYRYDAYCVQTGSMESQIHVGAIVIVNPHKTPEVGDIGAYASGNNIVIHRVIAHDEAGYTFKGDANQNPDLVCITDDQIRGKVVLTVNVVSGIVRRLGLVR